MKKILFFFFLSLSFLFAGKSINAQQLKIGVFDIDLMVQAMPDYHNVDSLVRIYETDSLGAEYQYYMSEYSRLDSTYKADSVLQVQGKIPKTRVDLVAGDRQKMAMNLVYWQQIAQNKSNNKRSQLAQPLYTVVANAYKKILDQKKYNLVLKPQSYEMGFPIDNLFISVAKELKLTELPQDLLYLGDDPDAKEAATKQPATKQPATKPKN